MEEDKALNAPVEETKPEEVESQEAAPEEVKEAEAAPEEETLPGPDEISGAGAVAE